MKRYVLEKKIEDQMELLSYLANAKVRKKLLEGASEEMVVDSGYRILRLVDGIHVYYIHLTSVVSGFAISTKEMYARVSELEYLSKLCVYKYHYGEYPNGGN